jgi:Domain of unknown function (DUF5610)
MDSFLAVTSESSDFLSPTSIAQSKYASDALIIDQTLGFSEEASTIDLSQASQTLALSAQEILEKINKLISDKLPNGVESLNPEDHTAERTAETIVSGITALFSKFKESNPELSPEDQIKRFMDAARSGVETGYSQAYEALDGLGAFSIEGVKSGIEQTKILIADKLDAFEKSQLNQLNSVESNATKSTKDSLLIQAGVSISA